MTGSLTIETAVDFGAPAARRRQYSAAATTGRPDATGAASAPSGVEPVGRVPRITRLLALALRIDGLIRSGQVADYAAVAKLGHVSRARVTQIMNLTHLAPDIQEEILFLPKTLCGRDPIRDHALRPIAAVTDWNKQRKLWAKLKSKVNLQS